MILYNKQRAEYSALHPVNKTNLQILTTYKFGLFLLALTGFRNMGFKTFLLG